MPRAQAVEEYWCHMENTLPEIWPGSTPWHDEWGSFGTYPDEQGYGATIHRVRAPAEALDPWWQTVRSHYARAPRVTVDPASPEGLPDVLAASGYTVETEETVLVLDREEWATVLSGSPSLSGPAQPFEVWEVAT